MEFSKVEAAVCLKALRVAERSRRQAGDKAEADAFAAMRETLWARYRVVDQHHGEDLCWKFVRAESLPVEGGDGVPVAEVKAGMVFLEGDGAVAGGGGCGAVGPA